MATLPTDELNIIRHYGPHQNFMQGQQLSMNSLVSGGCIVSGAEVRESVLFSNVRVREASKLMKAVVFPRASIGANCRITQAIIDEDCVIPDGTVIGENAEDDARRFYRTEEGVALVCPHMLH